MAGKPGRTFVIHPFLFVIYSVIGVYSQNASQVPADWIFRPLVFLVLLTFVVYLILQKIFSDHEYSGFVCTLALNWIFMGHLYRFLSEQSSFWRTPLGGICAFLLVSAPLGFLASRWVWKRLSNRRLITAFLNVAALSLIVYPLWITIGMFYTGKVQVQSVRKQQAQFEVSLPNSPESPPDVYLIIVDGYGRADLLQELYDYDNTQFMEFVKEQGFYIADQATTNYPQTALSLSSMLNLQYLDEYTEAYRGTNDHNAVYELIQHSVMRQVLQDQGYTFMALPSASLVTQIRDADVYFNQAGSNLNEFEALLLSTTILGVAGEAWGFHLPVMGYELHREYIVFSLEKLRELPELPGPKFVFAHIMLPHPPFVFDRNGGFTLPDRPYIMLDGSLYPGTTEEYQTGYRDQITFLNQKLTAVISDILARSANPPVILLQADHGPGAFYNVVELDTACLSERFSILSAYYFPDGDYELLYPTITPVNTLRVVLKKYFGAPLELLEDRNYYAGWSSPYVYTDVTDQTHSPCSLSEDRAE